MIQIFGELFWRVSMIRYVSSQAFRLFLQIHPSYATVERINNAKTDYKMRYMFDTMGVEKYIKEAKIEPYQKDRFGTLYAFLISHSTEYIKVVEVVNSTPEPDGSYKHYFLRVHPRVLTAHEAVAWTFNLAPGAYNPTIET